MAWSGGTYTKGNAATGGWTGDASLGIGIEAGRHDTQDNDFATGINQCLNKDGSNAATGNLNLGGYLPANIGAGTAGAPAICVGNDVNTGVFGPAADTWAVATNGSERVRVSSTGNLGIGTSAPATLIDIQTATENSFSATRFTADASPFRFNFYKSRGATIGTNTIVQNSDSLGVITFYGANGTGYTNGAEIRAEVDGVPGATNDMPTRLRFATTSDGSGALTERMRISSNGYISIGTVTATNYVTIYTNGNNIPASQFYVNAATSTGTECINLVKYDNNSTTANVFQKFYINQGATGSGQINANGASAAAFGSFSDIRLKENIVDLPSQLAAIRSLRPVEFDYRDGSGHQIGFIAQEVEQIYPDLVGIGDKDMLTLTDLNKNDARLIKAFQELAAKVDELEARVAELEA